MLWLAMGVLFLLQLDTFRRFERIEKIVGGLLYRDSRGRGFQDADARRLS
jgi:hypothetical protein